MLACCVLDQPCARCGGYSQLCFPNYLFLCDMPGGDQPYRARFVLNKYCTRASFPYLLLWLFPYHDSAVSTHIPAYLLTHFDQSSYSLLSCATSQKPHLPIVASTSLTYRFPIPLSSHFIKKVRSFSLYATSHRRPSRRPFFPSPAVFPSCSSLYRIVNPIYFWLIPALVTCTWIQVSFGRDDSPAQSLFQRLARIGTQRQGWREYWRELQLRLKSQRNIDDALHLAEGSHARLYTNWR